MDFNELVTVFTIGDPVKAEIVKNFLQGEGIRCFLEGENQAELQGIGAMEIKILVPAHHADRARKLIEQHEPHKKKS